VEVRTKIADCRSEKNRLRFRNTRPDPLKSSFRCERSTVGLETGGWEIQEETASFFGTNADEAILFPVYPP
jgi:hypothetical protein